MFPVWSNDKDKEIERLLLSTIYALEKDNENLSQKCERWRASSAAYKAAVISYGQKAGKLRIMTRTSL